MPVITALGAQQVYNSHARPTTELTILLDDGRTGRSAHSQGETVGVHEDRGEPRTTRAPLSELKDVLLGAEHDQASLDAVLVDHLDRWSRNTCSAVSEAFYLATDFAALRDRGPGALPGVCVNLFNGGAHAYTNPVLSDVPEFLVLTDTADPNRWMPVHDRLQEAARTALSGLPRREVNGHDVAVVGDGTTTEVVLLARQLLESTPGAEGWDLMLDASAGDLLHPEGGYELGVTGRGRLSSEQLVDAWGELVHATGLGYLEDPFGEHDHEEWSSLRSRLDGRCRLVGDNYTSTDPDRVGELGSAGRLDAVIVKPNQAGTVSTSIAAVEACRGADLLPITSHRSISVESTFLADLTWAMQVPLVKIGPLQTDYSSVLRLNRLLRLEAGQW